MELPTTYYSSSGRREVPIRELENGHLHRAAEKALRERCPNDPMTIALSNEVVRREHEAGNDGPSTDEAYRAATAHRLERAAPAADRTVASTDNQGPTEREAYALALEAEPANAMIQAAAAALELKAAKLPKADEIKAPEQIAAIDAWMLEVSDLQKRAERLREPAKAPWLMRGQVVDAFFNGLKKTLEERKRGIEQRKGPYLRAKAEAERIQREAEAEAQRAAAEEARRRAAEAAVRAQEQADAAEAARAKLEAEQQAAANQEAIAEAFDVELEPDGQGLVDAHDDFIRSMRSAEYNEERARDLADIAVRHDDLADRLEEAAASPHRLAKTGESGLKEVWKYRVVSQRAFAASIGPLEPFLKEADITDALERAAKADPRPAIPGVEFFMDYDVTTNTRRGSASAGHIRGPI